MHNKKRQRNKNCKRKKTLGAPENVDGSFERKVLKKHLHEEPTHSLTCKSNTENQPVSQPSSQLSSYIRNEYEVGKQLVVKRCFCFIPFYLNFFFIISFTSRG